MRFVWFIAFRIVRLQFTVFLELKSAFCLVCIVRGLYKTLWLKKVNNYIVKSLLFLHIPLVNNYFVLLKIRTRKLVDILLVFWRE